MFLTLLIGIFTVFLLLFLDCMRYRTLREHKIYYFTHTQVGCYRHKPMIVPNKIICEFNFFLDGFCIL